MSEYKDFKDNILYKISMTIFEAIVISAFVVVVGVGSLGLLLYPTLSGSYYYHYQKQRTGNDIQFRNLWIGLKKSFKQTFPLGLVQLLILYVGYVNYANFGILGFNSNVFYYFVMVSTILLTLHNFYTLQLLTFFEVKIFKAINLSSFFMLSYFFSTLTIVALFIGLIFSVFLQPALIIIVLGVFIHISSLIFKAIFKKHSPEEDNENKT